MPSVLEPRRRIDRALHAVIMEAYVAGVSTRSVDDLVAALGAESGKSKSEVRLDLPGGEARRPGKLPKFEPTIIRDYEKLGQ